MCEHVWVDGCESYLKDCLQQSNRLTTKDNYIDLRRAAPLEVGHNGTVFSSPTVDFVDVFWLKSIHFFRRDIFSPFEEADVREHQVGVVFNGIEIKNCVNSVVFEVAVQILGGKRLASSIRKFNLIHRTVPIATQDDSDLFGVSK